MLFVVRVKRLSTSFVFLVALIFHKSYFSVDFKNISIVT